jgi:hypothetical protein
MTPWSDMSGQEMRLASLGKAEAKAGSLVPPIFSSQCRAKERSICGNTNNRFLIAQDPLHVFYAVGPIAGIISLHLADPFRALFIADTRDRRSSGISLRHHVSPSVIPASHGLWRTQRKFRSVVITASSIDPPQIGAMLENLKALIVLEIHA